MKPILLSVLLFSMSAFAYAQRPAPPTPGASNRTVAQGTAEVKGGQTTRVVIGAIGPHSVAMTWVASIDAAANPTLGYQVYRLNGACPSVMPATVAAATAAGFALISGATPITVITYSDTGFPAPPLPPGTYCYFVVANLAGTQSVPSTPAQAIVPLASATGFTITGVN
jgi:hypothetical protein